MDFPSKAKRLATIGTSTVFLLVLAVFSYSAALIDRFPGDLATSRWVQSLRTDWLDTVMETVSIGGLMEVATVLVVVAVGTLFILGRLAETSVLIAASVLGYGMRTAVKVLVARPRPSADLVQVIEQTDGYSFPSGHVMFYVWFLGILTVLVLPTVKPMLARRLILGSLAVALISVGLSRIYLGVHWLSDVVAGYTFGLVIVALAAWIWRLRTQARVPKVVEGE